MPNFITPLPKKIDKPKPIEWKRWKRKMSEDQIDAEALRAKTYHPKDELSEELIMKVATYFRVAREEGALRKWADGKSDAEEIIRIIAEEIFEEIEKHSFTEYGAEGTLPLHQVMRFSFWQALRQLYKEQG